MKKNYDLLHIGSGALHYCLKKTTVHWDLRSRCSKEKKHSNPLFAVAFLTLFLWGNPPIIQHQERPTIATESCAEFTFFSEGTTQGAINLPKFDPALGTLRGVELTTECTIMADVEEKAIQGNNYSLGFNIMLSTILPGQDKKTLGYQSQFRKAIRANTDSSSFVADFSETKKSTELITDHLAAFTGNGNVSIPLEVGGLVNFKNETSRISSNLKTKLCIKYLYD
jgi:hypothetical protein